MFFELKPIAFLGSHAMASPQTWVAYPPNNSQPRIIFFVAISVLLALMICPVGLGIGWTVYGKTASLLYGWTAGLVSFAISGFVAWKVVLTREFKRHAIELHEDRVVLDCKGTTSEMIYDDIWEFKVVKSDKWNTLLTIKSKRRKLEFPINIWEADDFASSLLQECPHAVYQDAKGKTHLPPVTEKPERVWKVKQRQMIGQAIGCLVGGVCLCGFLLMMVETYSQTGSFIKEGSSVPIKFIWLPFIGPFVLGYGIFLTAKAFCNGARFRTLCLLKDNDGLDRLLGKTEAGSHVSGGA